MYIIKRNGTKQEFDPEKINRAISAALQVCNCGIQNPAQFIEVNDGDSVELIQDRIEN
uniref:ATP cone domain protein n=1 Tax=CrAss-like virus sp. ctYsL76 TaxID=2826826 RepID=A0A8S5QLN5_9CAUD|nr:MAG TPA: ATP cone domain protein [CrAss-like virus sp. ctYsL76]